MLTRNPAVQRVVLSEVALSGDRYLNSLTTIIGVELSDDLQAIPICSNAAASLKD